MKYKLILVTVIILKGARIASLCRTHPNYMRQMLNSKPELAPSIIRNFPRTPTNVNLFNNVSTLSRLAHLNHTLQVRSNIVSTAVEDTTTTTTTSDDETVEGELFDQTLQLQLPLPEDIVAAEPIDEKKELEQFNEEFKCICSLTSRIVEASMDKTTRERKENAEVEVSSIIDALGDVSTKFDEHVKFLEEHGRMPIVKDKATAFKESKW